MAVPYPIIEDTPPWTQVVAGPSQFIYSTDWTANSADDILVYSRLPNVPANDILQLVSSSNYTVQFIGDQDIVQVTFLPGYNPPQYNIVTIMRDTSSERLNLYTNTNFQPSMLNSDFGTLTLVDQDNQLYWQQIVPRYNNSATVNVPIDTILPVLGANQFWVKNNSNTAFIPLTLPLTVISGLNPMINSILDINGNIILSFVPEVAPVNYFTMANAASGTPLILSAAGTDTDIQIDIIAKGIGEIVLATQASTNAISWFTGTNYQHETRHSFANTANFQQINWPDASGTVGLQNTGTWTPVDGSGASLTLTANASYTVIGNMVFAYATVIYPSTVSGANAVIGGLPFTSANQSYAQQGILSFHNGSTATKCFVNQNAKTIALVTNTGTAVTNAQMSTTTSTILAIYPLS